MFKRAFNGFHGTTFFTDLQPFKSSIFYSTSTNLKDGITNSPPMLEFLTKSVGFSEQEATSIVTKVSFYSTCTTEQPDMVINFLKRNGFDQTHIKRLIKSVPKVLRFKIDKNLAPKFRAFQELGLSGPDLGLVMSQHSSLLKYSLKAHIIPSLLILSSVFGSNEQLISFLLKTKFPKLLSYNLINNVPQNLLFLESYGLSSEQIKRIWLLKPQIMLQKTQWLENNVKAVEEKLGIPRTSPMFLHGITARSMTSEGKFESWLQVFRSYGWSETEISRLIRKLPLILNLSDELVMIKLKYFMKELGCGSDFLSARPALLMYSMEKRILPRTAVIQALKEKQLLKNHICLYTFNSYAESKFVKNFVVKFKDELPQLYEDYMKQTSGVSLSH